MAQKPHNLKTDRFRFLRIMEKDGSLDGEPTEKVKRPPATVTEILKRSASAVFWFFGECVAIILGLAFVWFYGLNVLLDKRTIDVSFLDINASLWFSQAFDGHDADIGSIFLKWNAQDGTISLDARNVVVRDKFRAPLQDINRLQIATDFDKALSGQIEPRWAKIDGGAVTWKRNAQDRVTVGFGTPNSVENFGVLLPENARRSGRERQPFSLGPIEFLDAKNAIVYVQDENSEIDLTFSNTDLSVVRTSTGFDVASRARFGNVEAESSLAWELSFSPDYEDFDFHLVTTAFNLSDIAPNKGRFAKLALFDIPLTSDISIISERAKGLSRVDLDVQGADGRLILGLNPYPVDAAHITASYDVESQSLNFEDIAFDAGPYKIDSKARLQNIGSPAAGFFQAPTSFDVDVSSATLNLPKLFDDLIRVESLQAKGTFDRQVNALGFDVLNIDMGPYEIKAALQTQLGQDRRPIVLKGAGRVDGTMTAPDLLSIWPTEFATGARRWIDGSVKAGLISDLDFSFDIPPGVFKGQLLANEDLTLNFKVTEGAVKYMRTMPPYLDVIGVGTLRGNSLEVATSTGRVGGMTVTRGKVDIPRLNPKGGDLIIEVDGYGGVRPMMELIDNKPFEFASKYGVKPEDFDGTGKVKMTITRPLLEFFDQNRILYEVDGQFENVTAPFSVGEHALKNGFVTLIADKDGMTIKGPVSIGAWKTNLSWQETFDFGATPTVYRVEGPIDRDTLDGFGVGLREYLGGTAHLSIDATGMGLMISDANFKADLTDSDIQLGTYWSKESGVQGEMTGRVSRAATGALTIDDAKINAPGLVVEGGISLADDFKLEAFDIRRANIPGFVDAAVKVQPSEGDAAFDVNVTGRYLDISPFISQALTSQTTGVALPVSLNASLERLGLNEAFVLRDTTFNFEHDGINIQHASLDGQTEDGQFSAAILRGVSNSPRMMKIDIPNASDAALAFFNLNSIKGGRMQVEAQLPAVGEPGALTGVVDVEDFVLKEAPVLAQMLSLASLKGLTDAMGGAGINFNELHIPFSYETGLLRVRDARAAGPALGLTGAGDIDFKDKVLDVDGVLVPAYNTNSALGSIPVIGDIFVGKKGEGIFALNYSVKGPFKQTQVAVNPLSALTPGFLRGIFSSQRDALVDAPEDVPDVEPKVEPEVPLPENEVKTGDAAEDASLDTPKTLDE